MTSGKLLEIPRHVAIIMDGNGRWAKAHGLHRVNGHREGVKSTRVIVEAAAEIGIEALTLYTFSAENWKRPHTEVESLMRLLVETIMEQTDDLVRNNIRLQTIGHVRDLTAPARAALAYGVKKTARNDGMVLNLALSYGGRQEIVDAANALIREGRKRIAAEDIETHLYTAGLPDLDLLIRTSGEMRLSNFMLWQSAYAEIIITDTLWPDFKKPQFLAAIAEYRCRHRRFGSVEET